MTQVKQKPEQKFVPESHLLKTFFKVIFYAVFFGIFLWVCGQLFLKEELSGISAKFKDSFSGSKIENISETKDLRVIYPQDPDSLEPTLNQPAVRQRLVNIYESLVKTDPNFKIRPSLAVSWGLIDNLTWEFELRKNVKFHDTSGFDANDAAASINRALFYPSSELSELLDSIEKLEIIDDYNFRIKTKKSDPLLLQKLSFVFIIPQEYEKTDITYPIGTASYKFSSWDLDGKIGAKKMVIEKFSDYWGKEAKFEKVEMYSVTDKSDRVNLFLDGKADLLTFVSYDAVSELQKRGFPIAAMPSLEVQLLLFDVNSVLLKNPSARKAVSLALEQKSLVEVIGGYAQAVSQFVSNGIFGFNPNISEHEFNIEKAKKLAEETGLSEKTLMLHLPLGLDVLGEFVRESLKDINVNVVVSYLEMDKLIDSMFKKDADIYFLGFKSELGDASDFLNTIVNSNGSFNVFNYKNERVDFLIQEALIELDARKRRDYLQEAMKIIVEEDIVGVPLFEYETVYSFADWLNFSPRIDGFVYFDELNKL